jgi:hypothetical protein
VKKKKTSAQTEKSKKELKTKKWLQLIGVMCASIVPPRAVSQDKKVLHQYHREEI